MQEKKYRKELVLTCDRHLKASSDDIKSDFKVRLAKIDFTQHPEILHIHTCTQDQIANALEDSGVTVKDFEKAFNDRAYFYNWDLENNL